MADLTITNVDVALLYRQIKAVERATDRAELPSEKDLLMGVENLLSALLDEADFQPGDLVLLLAERQTEHLEHQLERLKVIQQNREGLENPALQQTLTSDGEILDRAQVAEHLEEHHDD